MPNKRYDRQKQKKVDQGAGNMEGEETQNPHYNQHTCNNEKHAEHPKVSAKRTTSNC